MQINEMSVSINTESVVVVGAGIIGLSVALRLAMEGLTVSVIDRKSPMQECSYGNAGYLTESNIFPPLSKSILKSLPHLLLDTKSPLVVRMSYLRTFLPWAWRALRELPAERRNAIQAALSSFSRRAIADFDPLLEAAEARSLISQEGSLVVFRTSGALQTLGRSVDIWNSNGIAARMIDSAMIRDLEPALARDLIGAIHFPNAGRCLNPEALGLRYAEKLGALGMPIIRDDVRSIKTSESGVQLETENGSFQASKVVICAGYFSVNLLKRLGFNVPLASERGYHYMLPAPGVKLNRPIVFGEPYFAATPMRDGLRLAGTAEFSSPKAPPRMERAEQLYQIASSYLPGLHGEGGKSWMGVRPSFPDGKPAIGRLAGHPNILYAFGHGHSGLSFSATTSLYIRDLLLSQESQPWVNEFSIDRFGT